MPGPRLVVVSLISSARFSACAVQAVPPRPAGTGAACPSAVRVRVVRPGLSSRFPGGEWCEHTGLSRRPLPSVSGAPVLRAGGCPRRSSL